MSRDIIVQAFTSLRHHWFRAALSMLGISWGIVSVVVLLAYGDGFRHALDVPAVTDVILQRALDDVRERHVVLREPEAVRPAQQGDLVSAEVDALRDGISINGREGSPTLR